MDWFLLASPLLLLPVLLEFVGCSALVDPESSPLLAAVDFRVTFDPSGGAEPFDVFVDIEPVFTWPRRAVTAHHLTARAPGERLADGRVLYAFSAGVEGEATYDVRCTVFAADLPGTAFAVARCTYTLIIGRDGLPLPVSFETAVGERVFRTNGCTA